MEFLEFLCRLALTLFENNEEAIPIKLEKTLDIVLTAHGQVRKPVELYEESDASVSSDEPLD